MSCSPQLPRPEKYDSSDYGSDFTPEEDELLNELLTKAATENATVHTSAASASISTSTLIHSAVPATPSAPAVTTPDAADTESLQPAVFAPLVVDIEDGIEDPSGARLPKVLGREKPRSPWRKTNQRPWLGSQRTRGAVDRTSPVPNNRFSPFGMTFYDPL